LDLFQKNYKCLAIPYFLYPKCGLLSSSPQIWRIVLHDVLLDTKVVSMNGRDWDIIPKFTYPTQSNFVHFMCSLDRNPKFSPLEGMTLALQAHLFNRLYQTRATKLKFDTHFLGPAPTGTISDYRIGSIFWKFYLNRTSFTLGEPVSLVKMFRLFRLEQIVLVFRVWTK